MRTFLVVCLFWLSLSTNSNASDLLTYTVGDLTRDCASFDRRKDQTTSSEAAGICQGYLVGVLYGRTSARSELGVSHRDICWQSRKKIDDLVQVFIAWTRDHPDQITSSAATGIENAFKTAWPCQQ